ncbi:hypothetical protein Lal_00045134, partial [Lupinus albus]
RKVVLSPLSPKQASEDQKRLKAKIKEEKRESEAKHGDSTLPKAQNLFSTPKQPLEVNGKVKKKDKNDSNSRSNSLKEGGYDDNQLGATLDSRGSQDQEGPMAQTRAKSGLNKLTKDSIDPGIRGLKGNLCP